MRALRLPSRYWNVQEADGPALVQRLGDISSNRSWQDAQIRLRQVSVARQKKTLGQLFESNPFGSRVIGIGSEPTDVLGMTLAAALLRRAQALRLKPLCISMAERPDALTGDPDVVILHNLMVDCHQMRRQICRDWLDRLDDSFRIVVVAGGEPYSFIRRQLSYPVEADDVLYLRGDADEDV